MSTPPRIPPHPAPATPAETAVCAVTALPLPAVDGGTLPARLTLLPGGGRVVPGDGRAAWTVDDAAALVARSLAAAPAGLLAIDYDHAADLAAPKGGPAPAAGWITALSAEADGSVTAAVEWTEGGAAALSAKAYRFISPSFTHDKGRRVLRLLGAGLTNRPALPQLPQLAHVTHEDLMDKIPPAVLAALGLPADAGPDAAVTAIATAKADATASTMTALCAAAGVTAAEATVATLAGAIAALRIAALKVPLLEAQVATLSAQVKATNDAAVAAEVDDAIRLRKFTPAQRDAMLALAHAAPDSFRALASAAVPMLADPPKPAGTQAATLSAEEKAVCAAMGLSEEAYVKSRGGAA